MSAYMILNAMSHSPTGALSGATSLVTGSLQLTKKTEKPTKAAR